MRVTLIHNPSAGNASSDKDELLAALRRAGYEPVYRLSKAGDLERALDDPGEFVIAAGGDGTVGNVAKLLAGRDVPLAVVPSGTANNIASALGVPRDVPSAIVRWRERRVMRVDLGVAEGAWGRRAFMESVGGGLFAEGIGAVEKRPAEEQGDEVKRARRSLADVLARMSPRKFSITVDGEDASGRYLLVEVMNIRCVGPNLVIAPDADPVDGLLDVVIVGEGERGELEEYLRHGELGEAYRGGARVCRGGRVDVAVKGCPIHVDDETWPEACGAPGAGAGGVISFAAWVRGAAVGFLV